MSTWPPGFVPTPLPPKKNGQGNALKKKGGPSHWRPNPKDWTQPKKP